MALLAFEGFEGQNPNGRAGLSFSGATPNFTAGRFGGIAMQGSSSGSSAALFPLTTSSRVVTLSMATKVIADPLGNGDMMQLRSNGTRVSEIIYYSSTNTLRVYGAGGYVDSGFTPTLNTWYRFELETYVHNSAGYAKFYVDGNLIAEYTGDTEPSSFSTINSAVFYGLGKPGVGSGPKSCIDDIYILDDTGLAPFNASLGDVRVDAIVPNGNGNSSQFIGSDSDSIDNYQLVDEIPNNTADYVTGSAGDIDLYEFTDLAASPTEEIFATQTHYSAKKSSVGYGGVTPIARENGVQTEYDSLGVGYDFSPISDKIRHTSPDGTPWTVSKVNAAQFGYKNE